VVLVARAWLRVAAVGTQGGEHQVVKAVQDEASPAILYCKTPKAQGLRLAEREGVLWRYLQEAHNASSSHPCDGRAVAAAVVGELTESAENETNSSVRLGSAPCAKN
jgi:deoxyxylulose-5-phosphate synthase